MRQASRQAVWIGTAATVEGLPPGILALHRCCIAGLCVPPTVVVPDIDPERACRAARVLLGARNADLHTRTSQGWTLVTAAVDGIHGGRLVAGPTDGRSDVVLAREITPAARRHYAPERRICMPRLRRWQRPHRDRDGIPLPPWAMRLARLARSVRPVLATSTDPANPSPLTGLDWVDDGRRCWLVAITVGAL
ncbi:MAG: hypothetical protein ACR2FF_08825 [Mycobacteriales bacterium]|nr:MAG: hypothetical protein DLM56_11800 [Pseudonocardiales bacterium]